MSAKARADSPVAAWSRCSAPDQPNADAASDSGHPAATPPTAAQPPSPFTPPTRGQGGRGGGREREAARETMAWAAVASRGSASSDATTPKRMMFPYRQPPSPNPAPRITAWRRGDSYKLSFGMEWERSERGWWRG